MFIKFLDATYPNYPASNANPAPTFLWHGCHAHIGEDGHGSGGGAKISGSDYRIKGSKLIRIRMINDDKWP
jgi:hypothetical protein